MAGEMQLACIVGKKAEYEISARVKIAFSLHIGTIFHYFLFWKHVGANCSLIQIASDLQKTFHLQIRLLWQLHRSWVLKAAAPISRQQCWPGRLFANASFISPRVTRGANHQWTAVPRTGCRTTSVVLPRSGRESCAFWPAPTRCRLCV